MKFLLGILLLALFLLGGYFAAVVPPSGSVIASNPISDVVDAKMEISLELKDVSANGLTYVMTNHSDSLCKFGTMYFIEQEVLQNWTEIPHVKIIETDPQIVAGWTLGETRLGAGESVEVTTDWKFLYGTLGAGTYRFVKRFGSSEPVTVEFEIK